MIDWFMIPPLLLVVAMLGCMILAGVYMFRDPMRSVRLFAVAMFLIVASNLFAAYDQVATARARLTEIAQIREDVLAAPDASEALKIRLDRLQQSAERGLQPRILPLVASLGCLLYGLWALFRPRSVLLPRQRQLLAERAGAQPA